MCPELLGCQQLHCLDLSHNPLTPEILASMVVAFPHPLTYLDISGIVADPLLELQCLAKLRGNVKSIGG